MQKAIQQFASQYGLTRNEVVAEIEKVFSSILSQWYGLETMVFLRKDLDMEAVLYNKINGTTIQRFVDFREIKGANTLLKHLDIALSKAGTIKQTQKYKFYERELRWAEVLACRPNGELLVESEIIPGEQVIAVCPLNRIGLHERNLQSFAVGQIRAFHIRRIDPVLVAGTPKMKIVMDRVSKTLVESLLQERLTVSDETIKIHCVKRYVGHKSFVITSRRLPKSAILAVSEELHERIQVRFVSS
ncbi:MAG: hypothetical protein U9R57_00450 [Thermodesulfobacteriota bacterium]|nr:hypothetical protein [Thermodesulfobacteriota bacterium]